MHDGVGGGNEQQHTGASGSDPKIFVATTLAAFVLAGSAYIWKSGTIPILRSSGTTGGLVRDGKDKGGAAMPADAGPSSSRRDAGRKGVDGMDSRASVTVGLDSPRKRRASQGKREKYRVDAAEGVHDGGTPYQEAGGSLGRSSRPKERRRRGKDLTKELVKSGKLNKVLNNGKAKADLSSPQERASPSPSRSRVSSVSHGQSSTPRPQRRPFPSPTRTTSPSDPLSDRISLDHISSSLQPSRFEHQSYSRSRSRTRQRPFSEHENLDLSPPRSPQQYAFDSLTANHEAGSTSSASSTVATEATASSSASTSTAASSLKSALSRNSGRGNDSDGTPKAESAKSSGVAKDPWDWDRDGELNSPILKHPAPAAGGSTNAPRIQPEANVGRGSSSTSEVLSPIAPLPYASISSANGTPASSSTSVKSPSVEKGRPSSPSSRRYDHDDEIFDEAEEISFPSLNTLNTPYSSSGSPYSTGPNSTASSVSRPQSRASTSSATSSKGKAKNTRAISGLTSLSTKNQTPPMASAPAAGQRRAPTPADRSVGRPSTPSSSSPSTHPPASPSSPHTNSGNSGNSVTVSAQTQLASLRGALEAARLREEKNKADLEKATRDVEALRWENAAWRRREGELQSHIQQMMHQMQAYASYTASINQHAQGQPNFNLELPTAPPGSGAPFPQPSETDILTSQEPAEVPTRSSADTSESENDKQDGSDRHLDVNTEEGPSTSTVPGDAAPPSNGGGKADELVERAAEESSAVKDAVDASSTSSPPLPQPPTAAPQTILPFAPQPHHGPFSPAFPGVPMPAYSPFLHHPGTPNPQSPMGMHSPFPFSPHGLPPHPHFPLMPLGLSGIGPSGHIPGLQNPIPPHPMMMMHPGSFPGSPSSSTPGFPSLTPSTHGMHSSHPSPLWTGMVNGSNSGPPKLGNMSPVSGPSSPLPPYFQLERGRKGWQTGRPRSLVGSVSGKLDGADEGEGSGLPPHDGAHNYDCNERLDDGDDDDDVEFNPLLADAILKRPGSIRMNSKRSTSNFARDKNVVGLAGSVSLPGMVANGRPASLVVGDGNEKSPVSASSSQDQSPHQEVEEEFTFPSLSELGNVAREKRVGTPALAELSSNANGGSGHKSSFAAGAETGVVAQNDPSVDQ